MNDWSVVRRLLLMSNSSRMRELVVAEDKISREEKNRKGRAKAMGEDRDAARRTYTWIPFPFPFLIFPNFSTSRLPSLNTTTQHP